MNEDFTRSGARTRARRRLPVVVALLAAALVVRVGGSGPPADASAAAAGPAAARSSSSRPGPADVLPAGGEWTVTLLTGQVVEVRSDAEGRVTALLRRGEGPIRTLRYPDGDVYVVPATATPLLDQGLDRELFNVTGLVRQGYDDAASDVLPLIVEHPAAGGGMAALAGPEQPLPSIDAVAIEVPKAGTVGDAATRALLPGADDDRRAAGTRVWLDRRVSTQAAPAPAPAPAPPAPVAPAPPPLDGNLTQIGADDAWAAGFTGAGVRVAVLDTGVDATHPDLAGQIVARESFVGDDAVDRHGHGTHVAALVAGSGAGAGGARSGVAPDAELLVGKVLDDHGGGFESDLIAGMEWAAGPAGADVVSMSLGIDMPSDGSDPVSRSVDRLTEAHDTLFVVAAGNSGPVGATVNAPGVAAEALTVGAVDAADQVAGFSSRGPVTGTFGLKPDVVAPGVDIVAARAAGTSLGDPLDDRYTAVSGTSMATPQVAGAVAVLAQQRPDWSAHQLKNTVMGASAPVEGDGYDHGAGRVDIGAGTTSTLRPERDAVELSLPHPRTAPHTETLTWTNAGDQPVTASLDAELEDRHGDAVDPATVTVAPAQVTVAPGATGSATLRVDGPDLGDGLYTGTVVATAPGRPAARTPIAVHAAAEEVALTVHATPPPGVDGPLWLFFNVVDLDDYTVFHHGEFVDGDTTTVVVPTGRYAVVGDIFPADPDTRVLTQVGDPDVTIDEDTTVVLDGAAAVPLHPTAAGVETSAPVSSSSGVASWPRAGAGGFGVVHEVQSQYPGAAPVHVTPMAADREVFSTSQVFRLQAPHLTARIGDAPIEVVDVFAARPPAEGAQALTAVDAGDGHDLSGTRGRLAVVGLPDDPFERVAVTERARDAGTALLAFVAGHRSVLTLLGGPDPWADVPVVGVAGESATALRGAAAAGRRVTVTVTPSPFVYDVVTDETDRVTPAPVITRAQRNRLARLDEDFHRDPGSTGGASDLRYATSAMTNVAMHNLSAGPLPEHRVAYLTPGVTWRSTVVSPAEWRWWHGEPAGTSSQDLGRSYAAGSRTTVSWFDPPLPPGPVGSPDAWLATAPTCFMLEPTTRTADTLRVGIAPLLDGPDQLGWVHPAEAHLTLERDGAPIGSADGPCADFAVPAEPGTYRLTYTQDATLPSPLRSHTTWTFASAAPAGGAASAAVPFLVVDHDLPLDTRNQPTGTTATVTVRRVTGDAVQLRQLRVWTSVDGGTSWQAAAARQRYDGTTTVILPRASDGTPVALRVDARDRDENRIEQTLLPAYIA